MLLRLQKFDIDIRYKKGKELYLANTLSRAHHAETEKLSEFCHSLTGVDQKENITVGDSLLEDTSTATCQDCNLQELKELFVVGWASSHKKVPKSCQSYFGCREDLIFFHDFIMKGEAIVVPKQLRAEILRRVHDTAHMGIEACLR